MFLSQSFKLLLLTHTASAFCSDPLSSPFLNCIWKQGICKHHLQTNISQCHVILLVVRISVPHHKSLKATVYSCMQLWHGCKGIQDVYCLPTCHTSSSSTCRYCGFVILWYLWRWNYVISLFVQISTCRRYWGYANETGVIVCTNGIFICLFF